MSATDNDDGDDHKDMMMMMESQVLVQKPYSHRLPNFAANQLIHAGQILVVLPPLLLGKFANKLQ